MMKTIYGILAVWLTLFPLVVPTRIANTHLNTDKLAVSYFALPTDQQAAQVPVEYIWTRWRVGQYALADDGQSIWIGTAMGLLRWDKTAGRYERVSYFEGFPQVTVYAAAVDASGNRWFGGDGGLSRLDPGGRWTHYTPDNSGLHAGTIDGIAVETEGTVWASHGLPDGAVSRLNPDGTWRQFPNRAAAIVAGYSGILSTQNINPLWLAANGEVWMGYWVYDGQGWSDRLPTADGVRIRDANGTPLVLDPEPLALDKDSAGRVWALADGQRIFTWRDGAWTGVPLDICESMLRTLAIGPDDTTWIGYRFSTSSPFGIYTCGGITPLPPPGANCPLLPPCPGYIGAEPPSLTYVSTEGVWAIGSDWLRLPNAQVIDTQVHPVVTDLLIHPDGSLWMRLQSTDVQVFQDQATGHLNDDQTLTIGAFSELAGWATLPGGDAFIVWFQDGYHGPFPRPPLRWHQNHWIPYDPPLPSAWFTIDVFVQDDEHIWFGATSYFGDQTAVVGLDDKGTPADLSDDSWTVTYAGNVGLTSVAVDGVDRVWLGSRGGLFLRVGDSWQQIVQGQAICSLVPAANGVLFATLCQNDQAVIMIDEAGNQTTTSIYYLARDHLDLLRSTTRPNPSWSIASDGGVWNVWRGWQVAELRRYDEAGYRQYAVPPGNVSNVIAGPNERIWLTVDNTLWRMSPRPDFGLAAVPAWWWMQPQSSQSHRIRIASIEGYKGMVSLTIAGLPDTVAADVAPNPVQAGNVVTVTLHAGAGADFGVYPAQVIGVSDRISHTLPVTVTIAPTIYTRWLPLLRREG